MGHLSQAVLIAFVAALAPAMAGQAGDSDASPLKAKLKVSLAKDKDVSAAGGMVPLELTFTNTTDADQKFSNAEYRMVVLDKNGEQIENALNVTLEVRTVVLKGRSTSDRPGAFAQKGKLKAGQDYYLIVSVRNLVGQVKFTAK